MQPDESSPRVRWLVRIHDGIDQPVWIALVVALVAAATTGGLHGDERLVAMAAMVTVLALATRWRVAPLAIGVILVTAIVLRISLASHTGSDVLDVTAAAIRRVASGQNPYAIGYDVSRPPGAPFAYGPLALLWYSPFGNDGWALEVIMACVVLAGLAVRGKLLGLAIYALAPILISTAGDGTDDTSAGVLLLATFVVARRRPVLGGVLLAAAVAFKPYAAAWAPAFLLWGGWTVVAAFAVASVVLWSPVLFIWGIQSFLRSLNMANRVHAVPYWSFGLLWYDLRHSLPERDLLNNLRLVLGAVTAVVTLRWSRSLDGVILAGTLVYLVTLFMGFWARPGYFAAIAPVLCWRIDDWLRLPTRPLVRMPRGELDVHGTVSYKVP